MEKNKKPFAELMLEIKQFPVNPTWSQTKTKDIWDSLQTKTIIQHGNK